MKKTNKTFKRFAAITSASLLAACALMPAVSFADDPVTNSITIGEESDSSRTFAAYKLLNAEISEDNKNFKYTVNSKYSNILKTALSAADDADVITQIQDLDDAGVRDLAETLYTAIKNDATLAADETLTGGATANVEIGYYLIADTTTSLNDDVRSRLIINTADRKSEGVKIELKKNKASFEKYIWDTNDSEAELPTGDLKDYTGWSESADHDMENDVPFKLEVKLPSDIALYKNYKLVITDTLEAGLSRNDDLKIYLNNDTDVTNAFAVETGENGVFTISDNIKDNSWTFTGSDVITVYYTAKLTGDNVVFGNPGNWNEAKLEYTNDYYWNGTDGSDSDSTTETETEYAVAFTYKATIDKIDKNNAALEGAGFTLYKKIKSGGTAEYQPVGNEITGVTRFEFKGLDDGDYMLVETTIPEGYTKADDIEFTITAGHTAKVDARGNNILNSFTVTENKGLVANLADTDITKKDSTKYEAKSGEIYGEIVNLSGSELPSTGGIGTTIFYLGGGAMAAIGGIYLISKRRMKKSEE